jgi:hypothetical protein
MCSKKLTLTQLNGLRLASQVPSCLKQGMYNRPTERALERMGLIESDGSPSASGDGAMAGAWLITEKGKAELESAQWTGK